jgi:hypothetical protein
LTCRVEELIKGSIEKLDINDVVTFANLITGLNIPQPPKYVEFESAKLYICPGGSSIGTTVYPKGFSFDAVMKLFGKNASINCAVGDSQVKIKGSVDDFTLGPLSVRGVNEPRAIVDILIEIDRQHILIDGSLIFYDSSTAVSILIDVLPKPAFKFSTASILKKRH